MNKLEFDCICKLNSPSFMELYAIHDAFLSKKVQTIEMQRSNAIVKRLKIGYDKVFNIIHCAGRFFSETSEVEF